MILPKIMDNLRESQLTERGHHLKYFSKIFLGVVVFSASFSVMAVSTNHAGNSSLFSGAYVGASAGVLQNRSSIQRSSAGNGFEIVNKITPDSSSYSNNFLANLFLGYGMLWKRFYLAGELSTDISKHEQVTNRNRSVDDNEGDYTSNQASVEMSTFGFNADILPGLLLSPHTLLYGRIGVALNQITLKAVSAAVGLAPAVRPNLSSTKKETKIGLRLGFGLERWISKHIFMRLDYIYTFFGRMSLEKSSTIGAGTNAVTFVSRARAMIRDQVLMLGLVYRLSPNLGYKSITNSQHIPSGFYVGVSGGAIQNMYYMNGLSQTRGNNKAQLTSKHHITNTQGAGVISIGYGTRWNRLFFAAEAGTTISHNSIETVDFGTKQNNGEAIRTTGQVEMDKANFHLDILPGLFLGNSTVIYPRIGFVTTRVRLNTATQVTDNVGPALNATFYTRKTERKNGIRLGLGLEQAITQHLLFRLDYIYQYFGTIRISQTGSFINSSTISNNTKVEVANQNLLIGLIYQIS